MLRPIRSAAFGGLVAAAIAWPAAAFADQDTKDTTWAVLVDNVFDGREMLDDGLVSLEAPYRAEDAAMVPMTIRTSLPPGDPRRVERITLVIDENPAPVAATFDLGPQAGVTAISTRVRVNTYTPVHAVAELSDGSLHVAEVFVKASGGCAAPMAKDPEEAMANLGRMKLRRFAAQPSGPAAGADERAEAQVLIRHPNNSGLQMDQLTRFYIPAYFVRDLTVSQGDDIIFKMEGGISISEDPSFRFDYRPTGAPIRVEAIDTDENVFSRTFAAGDA